MIAFFGTGLLGSNFTRALIERGETVHVWNRTASKARALEADGAIVFDNPAAAARGAERVHLTLSDDAAVDEVLETARAGFGDDVIIVDHTTTSPDGTAERVRRWDERGIAFQHAPVFMGPQNARHATGYMLASGDPELFDEIQPELARMTGQLVYLGPHPERAAAFKLLGNLFLLAMTSGLVDMLALAKATGIKPGEAASLFDWLNFGASAPARIKRILQADFENPSWELAMARKDARLMIDAANDADISLAVIPAIAAAMDRWIEDGHGHDDWTVLAKPVL
jgi:3-hydroxyisobutyrate dehydrogenase